MPGVPVFVTITPFEPGEPGYEEGSEFNYSVGEAVSDEVVGSGMHIKVDDNGSSYETGGEIALDGTVESCEYYGLYIKYYIHVGTQSLKVIEKNDGVNIYDPGQRVKVILNPNDIMAYAPSAEEVE